MGHYQEEEIGVKGFMIERGSISKERPQGSSPRGRGGLLRNAPKILLSAELVILGPGFKPKGAMAKFLENPPL